MYCSRHHLPTVLNALRHLSVDLKFKTMDCVYKNDCRHFQKNKEKKLCQIPLYSIIHRLKEHNSSTYKMHLQMLTVNGDILAAV